MRFEFATAIRILFGAGTLREAGPIAAEMGRRALVVTGGSPERARSLLDLLAQHGVEAVVFAVDSEPTVDLARTGVQTARDAACDLVISFGGGSAIDSGKAIAALVTNTGDPLDYLEVIGAGQPISVTPLPFIAIPTTAGTGAEVTRNAVLASPEHRVKVSLRSLWMLPRAAIIDPELTYALPPDITASTGMDALTQVLEPFVSTKTNPLTDALCRDGLRRAGRSLERACQHGDDPAAREDMAAASLFGGLALANAVLGAVHGFAGPLGGMVPIPHGVACAALLPHVMQTNVRAMQAREPQHPALQRYEEIAALLTGDEDTTVSEGIDFVLKLSETLGIPRLSDYGVQAEHFPDIVDKSARASSMKGNPIVLTHKELTHVLEQAL